MADKTKAAPAAAAPSGPPAPPIPHWPRVVVWDGQRPLDGRVLAINDDGTCEIEVAGLAPQPITLHGVHRRQGQGSGWEPIAE